MIEQFGRVMVGIGLLLLIVGGLMIVIGRYSPSGRLLPGDIVIKRDGLTIYLPLATMVVVSLLLSGLLWLVSYLRR
jgi:hypothetical protein